MDHHHLEPLSPIVARVLEDFLRRACVCGDLLPCRDQMSGTEASERAVADLSRALTSHVVVTTDALQCFGHVVIETEVPREAMRVTDRE